MKELEKKFQNPPSSYGSLAFWAWNDVLEEDEISFQIKEMAKQNVGGFFMHSRDGLETEYLSDKWMSCITRAVEEAKKHGMTAWLYDEDRWPSGTAGGRVTSEGDAYRCKGLTLEICEREDVSYLDEENVLAVYAANFKDMEIYSYRKLPQKEISELEENEKRLVVRLEVSGKSEWFNHEAPPDNLNPDTVRAFIRHTHEKYAAEVGDYFGTVVPGIFTDEPSLADRHTSFKPNRSWIPWTYGFDAYYSKKRGRDIFETLPCIYFNHSESTKARHDYWYTVSELFCESYTGVLSTWCKGHNIAYTGHFLQEDKLGLCARVNGSIMPHYKYQDVPGIDMLGESTTEYMTVKQCTSVAHQFGKKEVLTETYGCTGWDFTFEGMKWIGDWQFVLGVTRRSEHLAFYSLRGLRKRDYPPNFNYNTTWWEKNHITQNYFSRLSLMLQEGEPIRSILILHPMSTAWSRLGVNPYGNPVRGKERDVPAINEYGYQFNDFLEYMSRQHFDYDLGDEILMASDGRVEQDKIFIGEASYKMVIIPPMDTIMTSTLVLLKKYMDGGGYVIMKAPFPTLVDGEKSDKFDSLLNHHNCVVANDNQEIITLLEKSNIRDISITNRFEQQEEKILYQYRTYLSGGCLFLVNNDRNEGANVRITIPREGNLEEWNLLTGEKTTIQYNTVSGEQGLSIEYSVEFGPAESKLYVWNTVKTENILSQNTLPEKALPQTTLPQKALPQNTISYKKLYKELANRCDVTLTLPNVYTLDTCRWRFEDGSWSDTMEVWRAQYEIREALGMIQIHNNGLEQRYKWIHKPHPKDKTRVELSFTFESQIISKDTTLVVERANEFLYEINGEKMECKELGWFIDKKFTKCLSFSTHIGKNEILMSCDYCLDFELEACYLLGDFGITKERVITNPVTTLYTGDWTFQGLLHYPGSVVYKYEFYINSDVRQKKWYLNIPDFNAVCITARVNQKEYEMPWISAAEADITDAIKEGKNILEVEVYVGPRNMLGPFHLTEDKRRVTNDACFTPVGAQYTEDYKVVPYGLMKSPRIYEAESTEV